MIRELDEELILVQMKPMEKEKTYGENVAELGETVNLSGADGAATGSCIGWICGDNNASRGYAYSDDNGAHLSYCSTSGYPYAGFYVRLSEEDQGKDVFKGKVTFPYISMKNVMMLPESAVYAESADGSSDKKNYYVWKIEQDELIKQYVLVEESYQNNGEIVILSGLEEGEIVAEAVR